METKSTLKIGKHQVEVSNPDKIFWPEEKFTKGDVIGYYRKMAKVILPYLKDRPESLNRHPDGINGENFYQKDVDHQGPDWLKTIGIHSESAGKTVRYLVCDDEATLVYMANLGCIEINPWHSRIDAQSHPDYCLIDLDPQGVEFDTVVDVAHTVHEILEKAGAKHLVKTTGKRGMHMLIPLGAKFTYDRSRHFAKTLVDIVNERLPKTTSLERHPEDRKHKVYLDYLQNSKGQTMAAPYCMRPIGGLRVSTPLEWSEIRHGMDPANFNIKTIFHRLATHGDLMKPILGRGIDIERCLLKLEK